MIKNEKLNYNDSKPPKDKNDGVLAFALERYTQLLEDNDKNNKIRNEILSMATRLLYGDISISEIMDSNLFKSIWKDVYKINHSLLNDIVSTESDEDHQADVIMELFDLEILKKYIDKA
jgi:hypothetical protein